MADKTGIQWTDRTWNPTRGCTRVSEGCRNCYAETVAARFSGPGQPYAGLATRGPARWTGKVQLLRDRLLWPLSWRKPQRIFVDSMSDLFHPDVPDAFIEEAFATMALARRHTFQVLTKRPERMLEFFERRPGEGLRRERVATVMGWIIGDSERGRRDVNDVWDGRAWPLPNVWAGVSVEDQATADARIPLLLETPAAVRFCSYEPALGPVNFRHIDDDAGARARGITRHYFPSGGPTPHTDALRGFNLNGHHTRLDWIIVGGESGPRARPFDVAWARATVAACRAAGVACFVKQLGARPMFCSASRPQGEAISLRDRKGGSMDEWPEDLRVREFPAVRT